MSFFTSFMFLFSVGAPAERREAALSLPIERLSSLRAFGVLAGVLFVRCLAILVSSLLLRSRPFVLPRHGSRFAHFFLALANTFVADGQCSHSPSSRIQPRECFAHQWQGRLSELPSLSRMLGRSWQPQLFHVVANRHQSDQQPPTRVSRPIVARLYLRRHIWRSEG